MTTTYRSASTATGLRSITASSEVGGGTGHAEEGAFETEDYNGVVVHLSNVVTKGRK